VTGGAGTLRIHVGTDVGGTFTDLWAVTGDGRQVVVKSPSTTDIIGGVLDAVDLAAAELGLDAGDFCAAVERFGHGTTAGLNALLTGRAAVVAVLTTAGFRDTLEIGRLKRQIAGLTELQLGDYTRRGRQAPVAPRHLVLEVDERIDRNGEVVVPLDEASVDRALDILGAEGVQAVAVCTLWSVANPAHELRIAERIRDRFPDLFVTLSHEIAPGIGEYARMSTTATNAALGPVMGGYLQRLQQALRARGLRVPVQVMTGAGGVVTAADLAREPVAAMMSGPAAGVVACQQLSRRLGLDRLLTIDVGGTSFDVGVVIEGRPLMRNQVTVAGADIHRPAIDVGTIGAGGGSIARVEHGALLVGPQSAGAVPGPVCYQRGGTAVTATDADLVLGVLSGDGFAGGRMQLSRDAAEKAVREQIAGPLGMTTAEAAWGVRQVLDSKMADLLRSVTIERGHDPREFVMFANGGQGPSHAWALCQELGITTFIVTPTATAQSALGTGTSDLRQSAERPTFTRLAPGTSASPEVLARLDVELAEAEHAARARATTDDVRATGWTVDRTFSLRYRGQAHHLDVPFEGESVAADSFAALVDRFEAQYEALFGAGAAFREAGIEVLTARVLVTAHLDPAAAPVPSDPLELVGSRPVVFDDPSQPVECPVYRTVLPAPGQRLQGPALVAYPGQTLVVPPSATAETDDLGNIVVRLGGQAGAGVEAAAATSCGHQGAVTSVEEPV
jgi:N-methylhydantoinase A